MKNVILIIVTLISANLYADIEGFNNNQLQAYTQSNMLKNAILGYSTLNINVDLNTYADIYIRIKTSNSLDRNMALEEMASVCTYVNIQDRSKSVKNCQNGSITEYTQSYITYRYTLQQLSQ